MTATPLITSLRAVVDQTLDSSTQDGLNQGHRREAFGILENIAKEISRSVLNENSVEAQALIDELKRITKQELNYIPSEHGQEALQLVAHIKQLVAKGESNSRAAAIISQVKLPNACDADGEITKELTAIGRPHDVLAMISKKLEKPNTLTDQEEQELEFLEGQLTHVLAEESSLTHSFYLVSRWLRKQWKWCLLAVAVPTVVLWAITLLVAFFGLPREGDEFNTWHDWLQIAGTVGDQFGFANAIFSALALFAAIGAIFLQIRELGFQRKELSMSRAEMRKQAEALEERIELDRNSATKRATVDLYDEWHDLFDARRTIQAWYTGKFENPNKFRRDEILADIKQHIPQSLSEMRKANAKEYKPMYRLVSYFERWAAFARSEAIDTELFHDLMRPHRKWWEEHFIDLLITRQENRQEDKQLWATFCSIKTYALGWPLPESGEWEKPSEFVRQSS